MNLPKSKWIYFICFLGPCTPHFYECVYDHGYLVAYEYYCPGGTVFDVRFNICNYPHNVPVNWVLL